MKKIFLIFTVLIFLLSGCTDTEQSIGTDVQDTVLYNNAYSYKDDDISFFVKERGYEFDEEYNNKSTTFSKKEILSLLQVENESIVSDNLFYELYLNKDDENFLIRGPLYNADSKKQYFSNLIIRDSLTFKDNMLIKIINNDEVIKEFEIKKVVK